MAEKFAEAGYACHATGKWVRDGQGGDAKHTRVLECVSESKIRSRRKHKHKTDKYHKGIFLPVSQHLGFYKWEMTPTFRGFESFRGFYT